ncbi:uncharacterized protein TNCV_124721 [Trichonephila clavipes]|nr:uncharacterized protein TNCV_124721 [Trichonephila clavipes]
MTRLKNQGDHDRRLPEISGNLQGRKMSMGSSATPRKPRRDHCRKKPTANCHMTSRCLKCGKAHLTKDCDIKERQENPYCINCEVYGHTACYTKCPKFPKPKKGSLLKQTPKSL